MQSLIGTIFDGKIVSYEKHLFKMQCAVWQKVFIVYICFNFSWCIFAFATLIIEVQIKPKLYTVCIGCDSFFPGPFLRLFPENNAH